jgi:hypothetical protein
VTSVVTVACEGATAVIKMSELTMKLTAGTLPNSTWLAPVKPLPVIASAVPPAVLPEVVSRLVTAGTAAVDAVNWSALDVDDVPLGVTTVICQVPAGKPGAVAMMALSEIIVKLVAAVLPKLTALAPVKPVPRMATTAPPAVLPELSEMLLTDGAAAAV